MMKIFNTIIKDKLTNYKGMYECECVHLQRSLPFRALFSNHVISDIAQLFPPETTSNLVYVTQGPGGLFFDFVMINKLIDLGYRSITVILIEELYQENIDIVQACLDFTAWFKELEHGHSNHPRVQPFFYKSFDEYAHVCRKNTALRGHVLLTVDPDDKKTIPHFESKEFRKNFNKILKKIMLPTAAFYTLYFQNNLRHMLLGRVYQEDNQLIIAYEHHYGDQNFTDQRNRLFLDNQEVLPCETVQYGVQIDDTITSSQKFFHLLEKPLKKN